jgi:hypothetical protein
MQDDGMQTPPLIPEPQRVDREEKPSSVILREHEIQFHSIAKLKQSKDAAPRNAVSVGDSQQFMNPLKSYNDEFTQPSRERLDTLGDNTPNMASVYHGDLDCRIPTEGDYFHKKPEMHIVEIMPMKMMEFQSSQKTGKNAPHSDIDNENPLDSAIKNPLDLMSDTNDQMSSGACDSPVVEKNSRVLYANPVQMKVQPHVYGLELTE